jgi:hypothetical protein
MGRAVNLPRDNADAERGHRPEQVRALLRKVRQNLSAIQNREFCARSTVSQCASKGVQSRRSGLVSADGWVRCVMACRIGWMGAGLGSGEELVHDLGAGGDDGS